REDFFFGRTAFTLEVTAGETAGGGVFFAVVDGEREELLAGLHVLRDAGGDEDVGLADLAVDGAIGELGDGAGGERDPEFGDRDGVFLIHVGLCFSDTVNVPRMKRARPAARTGNGS